VKIMVGRAQWRQSLWNALAQKGLGVALADLPVDPVDQITPTLATAPLGEQPSPK